MFNLRASMLLAGVLAVVSTACGGGGGGGGGTNLTPTTPTPPPTLTEQVVTGKALVPVVSVRTSREEFFNKVAAADHATGRQQVASSVGLGSMTQSSRQGFVVGLDGSGGNLIGNNGLFTITSTHDWNTDETIANRPCFCSINVFAGFYDEDGYGLMYMGGDRPENRFTAPVLYPEAKRGFLMGYYYQGADDFGVFVDATTPTATLRNFGSARYHGGLSGLMTGLDPGTPVMMGARMTVTVSWGGTPSINGMIGMISGMRNSVFVDSNNATVTNRYAHTISAALTFHGTDWSEEHKSFHNGTIGCVSLCETTGDSKASWGAMLVDNGSGGVDPFRLVGTYGLYQYRLAGHTVDWFGLIGGETPFDVISFDRGYGSEPRAPGRVLLRKVGRRVSDKLAFAPADFLSTLNTRMLEYAITSAATIDTVYHPGNGVTFYVDYRQGSPTVVRPNMGFDGWHDTPPARVGGLPSDNMAVSGSATYSGHAGGFYMSESGGTGGFVSTIDLDVTFGNAQPTLRGTMGYDFGGVAGKLSMFGGTWTSSIASFSDGSLGCASGCQDAGSFARWSAQFVDVTGKDTLAPEGVIGKFGARGLRQGQHVYDMYGLFAAVDDIMPPAPLPDKSTFFPTTPHGMVSGIVGRYHRSLLTNYFDANFGSPTVVKTSMGNFVDSGGTIQLASQWWDWRSDDYANCYCTMFLTGTAFDSNGKEITMGLSSDPQLRWGSVDYSDAKYGWVAGLWRLDRLPHEWRHNRVTYGQIELGLFVDGTVPDNIPTSGSADFLGYGTGYAVPSTSTLESDIEVIRSEVSINVNWASDTSPAASGILSLAGFFGDAHRSYDFRLTLKNALWSATDKKFYSGSIDCSGCADGADHMGAWNGLFVDTGSSLSVGVEPLPGLFAAAYAVSSVSVHVQGELFGTPIVLDKGIWDLYGWFSAQPSQIVDRKEELLRLPGRAVKMAVLEGFDKVYYKATESQRSIALVAASQATIDQPLWESKAARFGYVDVDSNHTGFWTYTDNNVMTIGIRSSGDAVTNLPTSGDATYKGNAVGFYKSSADDKGVLIGDVSMSMSFSGSNVAVTGTMDLDFGGTTGSFTMDHGGFTGQATDGNLGCGAGCEGVWGGSFVETADNRPDDTAPGGFLGSFGVNDARIGNETYDALGAFSATVEP